MCKRKYTAEEKLLINNIKKSNKRCYYCNHGVKESYRTIDHKIPVSRGGFTIPENLVMSCEKCNIEKGFLTEEEYREYKEIADMRVSKNIKVSTLTALINSYKNESDKVRKEKDKLIKLNNEIAKIQLTIRDSKFSASYGYKLCKMLQDNLVEREVVNKNIRDLEDINKYIKSMRRLTKDK
ncbi:MAG: HNH endonuclease, partial [Clostridium celatum]|nr:HNH endonuclease [Clostridium celatum]